MIKDFIYYWREYGFSFAWSFRKAIFWNWDEYHEVIYQLSDYGYGLFGSLDYFLESRELEGKQKEKNTITFKRI